MKDRFILLVESERAAKTTPQSQNLTHCNVALLRDKYVIGNYVVTGN